MEIEHTFISFIAVDSLPLDPTVIQKVCHDRMKRFPCKDDNTKTDILNLKQNINNVESDIEPLISLVEEKFNILHNHFQLKQNKKQKVTDAWVNINVRDAINEPHSHPNGVFSAVYYPKADKDSGRLLFNSPITAHQYVIDECEIPNKFNTNVRWIVPYTGLLVFFPSWLVHSVSSNKSVEERISIAFNSRFVDI